MERTFDGMSDLLPVVVTVVLAIALGASMRALGTGDYVSGLLADSRIFACASNVHHSWYYCLYHGNIMGNL